MEGAEQNAPLSFEEPCEEGHDDAAHLKQIIPGEIWAEVTKKLKKRSLNAVENLANSSEFFQNVVAGQRTSYLFEKVFPLVAKSVLRKEGQVAGLAVSDVLKCRAVCKQWNVAVDKFVAEKLQSFELNSMELFYTTGIVKALEPIINNNQFINRTLNEESLERNKSVGNFLQHFELTHSHQLGTKTKGRNPWIFGNILVNIYDENDPEVEDYHGFLQMISAMLSKYGGHVVSFSVEIHTYQFFWNAPSLLQEWLLLMPNLKTFSFQSRTDRNNYQRMFFERAVEDYPFPKMKYLEKMNISDLPQPMLNQLVRQNDHISTLSIENPEELDYNLSIDFPYLKTLTMWENGDNFIERLSSPQVKWPLESLKFFSSEEFRTAPFFKMIQNKFASTLVSLSLELIGVIDDQLPLFRDFKNCRVELPNLKNFHLEMDRNPACLDFLLPMSNNLEEISTKFGCEPLVAQNIIEETRGTIIQFYGFEEKMFKSNIWMIFKRLKKVKVTVIQHNLKNHSRLYTREDWVWMLNKMDK